MKGRYKIGLARILLILLLFLSLLLHETSAATINYTESTIDAANFQVISHTSYYDGTILLRLSYPLSTLNCNEQKLFLRLIHLDGSISELNIDVPQIPSENFCLNPSHLELDHIKIYALSSDYVLATYYCDLPNLNLCGLIIDWKGNILNNENLDASCDDDKIVQNLDVGFLWLCYVRGSAQLNWYKFKDPDSSGSINLLERGTLSNVTSFNSNSTKIFATEDGGYGVVTTENQNLSTQTISVKVTFIPQTSNNVNGPFQIFYLDNVQQLNLSSCNIAYDSYGYNCVINVIRMNDQSKFVNINFSSSGSVLSSTSEFTISNDSLPFIWDILPLYYGGLLILTENNGKINGLIYSNRSTFDRDWDIPVDQYNITKNVGLLPNNTIWAISKFEGDKSWTVVTSSLLSDYGMVQGYGNALVVSTDPSIDSTVPLMSTKSLRIKFTNSIQLSKGNISIVDYNSNIIRQRFNSYNGNSIVMTDDHTVEIRYIFESTFNRKDTLYYVLVDNGFVKDARIDQELLGIRKGVWKFSTDSNSEQSYLKETVIGDTNAIIRLSTDGTARFIALSGSERDEFTKNLASNLSQIIPCDINRIFINFNYQFDVDLMMRQALLLVRIKRAKREERDNDVSSSQIVKDLDLLIRNRDYNAMSSWDIPSLLDATYGAKPIPSLWNRYKYILIGVAIGFVILGLIYYKARKVNHKANNKVIFSYTFIMVDFALDIIFVSIHGYDLSWLYPTSVVFITVPILLNLIFTYIIITRETRNNKNFSGWWIKNSKTALLFTLLSGIDMEAIKVVSSQCFGSVKLSSPLLNRTGHCIFIATTVSFFMEDVPQFIILILYQRYTILPNIIPMLTLSSCALVLLTKLLGLIKQNKMPSEGCDKKTDKAIREFNKATEKNEKNNEKNNGEFTDASPILQLDDNSRKKSRKNFFSSGQYSSFDNKRNSGGNSNNNNSYFSEALKLFSSNGDNESPYSDITERVNEGNNYLCKDEKTGEPIFLLRDPEDYNVQKIKQLSHGKLVGDSIVSANKFSPGKLISGDVTTNIYDKRLSDVGIICNTTSDHEEEEEEEEEDKIDEEISINEDNNDDESKRDTQYSQYTGSGRSNSRGSTTDRTRSTHSFQTSTSFTTNSEPDDVIPFENTLKKQLSSVSLNQENNLGIISEKLDTVDDGDDGDGGDDDNNNVDEEKKENETMTFE